MPNNLNSLKSNWFFLLLLFVEGAALMSVELMGAKLVAPFYGSSLYVWVSVLSITILGLALGYSIGGSFSKRVNLQKLLIIVVLVSSLLVFAMPYSSCFAMWITSAIDLRLGILISCIIFLLPPIVCFGTVGPITVKLLSQNIENLGRIAGVSYFISTLGGIVSTIVFSFIIIPFIGLKMGTFITGTSLIFIVLFYLSIKGKIVKIIENINITGNIEKPLNKRSTKKLNQNHEEFKITRRSYFIALLEGVLVMIIELVSARMISPYFGNSLYTWGTVIGITLLSLSLGYYLGGFVADKKTNKNTLLWIILSASIFLVLMPFISKGLIVVFADVAPLLAVIFICIVLMLPPLLILGMIPSLLIRHLSENTELSGKVTGRVYSFSSIGSIVSLLIMGFFIIPSLGLSMPLIIIGLFVGIFPMIKLLLQKRYLALLFLPALLVSFSSQKEKKGGNDITVKYFSEGLLGQILVTDMIRPMVPGYPEVVSDRILFINRMGQSYINLNTKTSNWNYINYIASLAAKLPEKSNVLIFGLGGGVTANVMIKKFKFHVDAIELDARMSEVAKNFFDLSKEINVVIDDARHYIETSKKNYDLIIFDVFNGEILPSHVLSEESFKKTKELLRSDGFIIINFNGFLTGDIGFPGRSVYKTLTSAGLNVRILPTNGTEENRNCLFVATASNLDFSDLKYHENNGKELSLDSLFLNTLSIQKQEAIVFTDDKPNLDWYNMQAARKWRDAYNDIFTKKFIKMGIPVYN